MKLYRLIFLLICLSLSNLSSASNACMPFCDVGCTGKSVLELGVTFTSGMVDVINSCVQTTTSFTKTTATFTQSSLELLNTASIGYYSTYGKLDSFSKGLMGNLANTEKNYKFTQDLFNSTFISQMIMRKSKQDYLKVSENFSLQSSGSDFLFNQIKEFEPTKNTLPNDSKKKIYAVLNGKYRDAITQKKSNLDESFNKLKIDLVASLTFDQEKTVLSNDELGSVIHSLGMLYQPSDSIKDTIVQLALNKLLDGRVSDTGNTQYSLISKYFQSPSNIHDAVENIKDGNETSAIRSTVSFNQVKLGLLNRLISLKKTRNLIKALNVKGNVP